MMEIETELDKEAFLGEIDDKAIEWLVEVKNNYQRVLNLSVLKKEGKVYTYPIQEEHLREDEDSKYMVMPANITKTMQQKVVRLTKKLLAEVDTEGLFSFKYGIKGRDVELVMINPGVTVGDVATLHCTDLSIYEQVLNLLEGEKVKDGILTSGCKLSALLDGDEEAKPDFPYHKYQFDGATNQPVNLFVKKTELEK